MLIWNELFEVICTVYSDEYQGAPAMSCSILLIVKNKNWPKAENTIYIK